MTVPGDDGANRPAIDIHTLRQFVGEDEKMTLYFLERFLARLDLSMTAMRRIILQQQWRDVSRLAHKMKSSALAIGAARLAALCEAAEKCGAEQGDAAPITLLDEMEGSFIAVQEAVRAALHATQRTEK